MAALAAQMAQDGLLLAVIADEDTITGFLLAGVGNIDTRKKSNYLAVDSKTSVRTIEASFKEFTMRDDIAVIMISQNVANLIRPAIEHHIKPIPAVLEIPSKDAPYDPNQDSLLKRVRIIFGSS
ncbi:MAG: hypothetical protein WDW38_007406 [Sanguina aurantia]